MISEVYNMDCMDGMKQYPDKYFDLVVTDPPYGITQNKWDIKIDLNEMWVKLQRIVKINGAFIFTSSQPFTTDLINSNRKNFRYDLIWEKSIATGFLNANKMPLRGHETILIFYRKTPCYNPIKHKLASVSFKKAKKSNVQSSNYGSYSDDLNKGSKDYSRFPRSVFQVTYENSFFDSQSYSGQKMIHPTQKPIDLFRYFIKTYSNSGDNVLDIFMGSGSSRIAAYDENRNFTGYELDKDYFDASVKRFEQYKSQLKLFV